MRLPSWRMFRRVPGLVPFHTARPVLVAHLPTEEQEAACGNYATW